MMRMQEQPDVPRTRRAMRSLRPLCIVLSLTLLLTSCGGGGGGAVAPKGESPGSGKEEQPGKFAADSSMATIQKRGKLIVGLPLDTPPFSYSDPSTGADVGFDVDIARGVAAGIFGAKLEGKVDFVNIDPRDRELALEQNRVDIAMGRYAVTVPRRRFIDFAGPYFVASQYIMVLSQNRQGGISTAPQLNGKKICTVRGSTNVEELRRSLPAADTSVLLESVNACGAELFAGRVAAVAADRVDAADFLRRAGSAVLSLSPSYASEPYGIGINKTRTDLRTFVNDRLELLVKDGRWGDAHETHFGSDVRDEAPPVNRY